MAPAAPTCLRRYITARKTTGTAVLSMWMDTCTRLETRSGGASWPTSQGPTIVIPVVATRTDLPAGVQVMGSSPDDLTTIAFAWQFSRLVGDYRVLPRFA